MNTGKTRRCILVADDDPISRQVIAAQLEDHYDVVQAEDGGSAVELTGTRAVDLVLLDIHMPVLDGYQAASAIKQRSGERHVPVVFMTASNDEGLLACGIQAGGDDFLSKPASGLILRAKIEALLRVADVMARQKRQRDELTSFRVQASRDYAIARRIFEGIARRGNLLSLPQLITVNRPLEAFNGDIMMFAHLPPNGVRLFVGDFTGHGLGAAVGAMPVSGVFYAMAEAGFPIESMLAEINTKLRELLPRDQFLSACVADLDTETGRLKVWNGGLPDALVLRARDGRALRIGSANTPLGVLPSGKLEPEMQTFSLDEGDRVVLYTDGVVEVENQAGEMFGEDRLVATLGQLGREPGWTEALFAGIDEFGRGRPRFDDITLASIRFDGTLRASLGELTRDGRRRDRELLFDIRYDAESLRRGNPLDLLQAVLNNCPQLEQRSSELYAVISELISNAIDHGLLGLDSSRKAAADGFESYYRGRKQALAALQQGWVRLRVEIVGRQPRRRVLIRVEDSGAGYDLAKAQPGRDQADKPTQLYGRGLFLVERLCAEVKQLDGGRIVEAAIELDQPTIE